MTGNFQGEYGEFVTAESRNDVRIPKRLFKNLRGVNQRQIAFLVAKLVIDLLQPIHVGKEHQDRATGPAPEFQLPFRKGQESAAVVYARQLVPERKAAQFCLQHVLLHGALNRAHQEFIGRAILCGGAELPGSRLRAHVLQ